MTGATAAIASEIREMIAQLKEEQAGLERALAALEPNKKQRKKPGPKPKQEAEAEEPESRSAPALSLGDEDDRLDSDGDSGPP